MNDKKDHANPKPVGKMDKDDPAKFKGRKSTKISVLDLRHLYCLVDEIEETATRKNRASDAKHLLEGDLEIIGKKFLRIKSFLVKKYGNNILKEFPKPHKFEMGPEWKVKEKL